MQSMHLLLTRLWAQMEAPPQSRQMLLTRLCSQMEAPPQHMTHEMYWLRKGGDSRWKGAQFGTTTG